MELLPLIIKIPLRIISPLLYMLQKIAISRENSQTALITLRTCGSLLNCLVWCRKTSKDVTLNHNGPLISDPSAIAEIFNTIFQTLPPFLIAIFPIQIFLHCISKEHQWKIHFLAPLLIVKKLLI